MLGRERPLDEHNWRSEEGFRPLCARARHVEYGIVLGQLVLLECISFPGCATCRPAGGAQCAVASQDPAP